MWFWKKKKTNQQLETPKEAEPLKEPENNQPVWVLEIDEDADLPVEEGLIWNQYSDSSSGSIIQRRKPEGRFVEYRVDGDFKAAGKVYSTEEMLRTRGQEQVWDYDASGYHDMVGKFTDAYGRKVYYISERFPCYDRYDRQYENRFYRYYYLCEDNKLTRIRFADGSNYVSVTEDTATIDYQHWRKLNEQKWIIWE